MHAFIKKNMVMVIALLAAAITSIIIPPDRAYLGYFDLKTLTCLFCVLAVVCALKNVPFLCIRVISDTPGAADNIAQYENFWEDAPAHTFAAVHALLKAL